MNLKSIYTDYVAAGAWSFLVDQVVEDIFG
jgi:hypothetical protein